MSKPKIIATIEGFKTEKEFIQHLCKNIMSLPYDEPKEAEQRMDSLKLSAEIYLANNPD